MCYGFGADSVFRFGLNQGDWRWIKTDNVDQPGGEWGKSKVNPLVAKEVLLLVYMFETWCWVL